MPFRFAVALLVALAFACPRATDAKPLPDGVPVRGWTLLTGDEEEAMAVIKRAPKYDINHMILSHWQLINALSDLRNERRLALINRLIDAGHEHGIDEMLLWEHSMYPLRYYPERFRTGPEGKIDLDNPEFWEWFKADYRKNLDKVPNVDGLVLTFIETGARVEEQHSEKMKTNQEKVAAVVNAIAEVVIEERNLNLYARTFGHIQRDYDNVIGAIKLFKNPKIRLMMKEVPHDFFLTHPNDPYIGTIDRPTLVEYDTGNQYNGQNILTNAWPQYILRRFKELGRRPHVIGYVGRMDRYWQSKSIDTPSEVNLLALKRGAENPDVDPEVVWDEFITDRYGAEALPEVKAALKNSEEIVLCILYMLGNYVSNHSHLEYEPYTSYVGMSSGRWINPPISKVGHGVNREFHYWKDIINRLLPPFAKTEEIDHDLPDWFDRSWVQSGEQMDEGYLRYIITEKDYGINLIEESLAHIEKAKPKLKPEHYEELRQYFERTMLTAKVHRAAAKAYFGFRVWCRGVEHQSEYVKQTTQEGLDEIPVAAKQIREYPHRIPRAAYNWRKDADTAERYARQIREGWPAETRDQPNPNAGMKFP